MRFKSFIQSLAIIGLVQGSLMPLAWEASKQATKNDSLCPVKVFFDSVG